MSKTEAPVFCEAGVTYTAPHMYESVPKGMEKVEFRWKHTGSGKEGTDSVYLFLKWDIHKLLAHWNRGDWKYWVD